MARRKHHHVYVIELSKDVLLKPRFRKNNPHYIDGQPCVYVGMTGLDPDVRFDKHKAGIQANRFGILTCYVFTSSLCTLHSGRRPTKSPHLHPLPWAEYGHCPARQAVCAAE